MKALDREAMVSVPIGALLTLLELDGEWTGQPSEGLLFHGTGFLGGVLRLGQAFNAALEVIRKTDPDEATRLAEGVTVGSLLAGMPERLDALRLVACSLGEPVSPGGGRTLKKDALSLVEAARKEVEEAMDGNFQALTRLDCREERADGIGRTVTVLEQLTRVLQTLDCAANEIGAIE